jgi:hypothetical protein
MTLRNRIATAAVTIGALGVGVPVASAAAATTPIAPAIPPQVATQNASINVGLTAAQNAWNVGAQATTNGWLAGQQAAQAGITAGANAAVAGWSAGAQALGIPFNANVGVGVGF